MRAISPAASDAAMAHFSDRFVSASKLIIAVATLYAGAATFAHADDTAPASTSAPSSAASAPSLSAYLGQVSSVVRSRLFYPPAARARNANGAVGVSFAIGSSGAVTSFAITHSSGDPDLDAAARSLVQGSRFPPPPGPSAHISTSFNYTPHSAPDPNAPLPAYDPYSTEDRLAQERLDAVNPDFLAFKKKAMGLYWECVKGYAAPNRMDLGAAQKLAGPSCNDMSAGWYATQVTVWKSDHHQMRLSERGE
jgi:TonB family protein